LDINSLEKRYLGNVALRYDQERIKLKKFTAEQTLVKHLLEKMPNQSKIIDIPVGTGRFIELYKRLNFSPVGLDVSADMLNIAIEKAKSLNFTMPLKEGNILNIESEDNSFDIALSICFFNWVSIENATKALAELKRVSRRYIIISVRHFTPIDELNLLTPYGLFHFMLRPAASIKKLISNKALIIHKKTDVINMFRRLNLTVINSKRVEHRKYGTDYFIYTLEKTENDFTNKI